MKLISTITSVATLPLALVGRLVGAVTGRKPSVPAPPTGGNPDAASKATATTPTTPAAKSPAKKAPVKKATAKKAPAKEAPATTDLEPSPPPVTDIDASAEDVEVDVTPADVAAAMGTKLDHESDGGPEDAHVTTS